jgi:5'-nucleotidase
MRPGWKHAEIANQLSRMSGWCAEVSQSSATIAASPIRAREVSGKFALEGADGCAVAAASARTKPDIVLSGVNRGTNMADDVTYSGTIAAAMEGCLLGLRSIAFSQAYTHEHPVKWGTATHHGAAVARRVLATDWPRNVLVNINFPDVVAASVKGVRVTHQGTRGFGGHIIERRDPRGGTYYWIGYQPQEGEIDEASDIAAVRSGHISVTPLHLDLTHETMRRRLRAEFEASPVEAD